MFRCSYFHFPFSFHFNYLTKGKLARCLLGFFGTFFPKKKNTRTPVTSLRLKKLKWNTLWFSCLLWLAPEAQPGPVVTLCLKNEEFTFLYKAFSAKIPTLIHIRGWKTLTNTEMTWQFLSLVPVNTWWTPVSHRTSIALSIWKANLPSDNQRE